VKEGEEQEKRYDVRESINRESGYPKYVNFDGVDNQTSDANNNR